MKTESWRFLAIFCLLAASTNGNPAAGASPTQPVVFNYRAPQLASQPSDWLNTEGKALGFERGRVYVVEFWTFGCINCLRNLPAYGRWQQQFKDQKLTIIGVHTPETKAEKVTSNVVAQVKKLGITYPVLLDQETVHWKKWRQQVWPAIYLVDKRGHVRYRWLGELDWQNAGGEALMTKCIAYLLSEPESE